MVKKLAALAGAGAMLLSTAVPVFANDGWWWWHHGSKDVAIVTNSATANANTGGTQDDIATTAGLFSGGTASAGSSGSRYMTTGDATAKAKAVVVANTHLSCGPCGGGGYGHKDFAMVGNVAGADANTGGTQDDIATAGGWVSGGTASAGSSGSRYMTTGNATAKTKAWVVVNTHVGGWPL